MRDTFENKIFISTTLPYANGTPHVGHSLEFIQGDFLARYYRKSGDVKFNLGLDEHGQKIFKASQEAGLDTQEYLDRHYVSWLSFCKLFDISYDNFYRTSSREHHRRVSEIWNILIDKGLIYNKKYTGKYCVGCESFKPDKDIIDGKCPDHPYTDIEEVEEENYFLKLEELRTPLLSWIESCDDFLVPNSKLPELINLIKDISDISVSRLKTSVPWGIPVPNDSEQTIYIWFEALSNYFLSAGDYWDGKTIQICGPDNIKFQGVIFQGILKSLNIKHTDRLLVHGTILDDNGKKMSKTVGNVVDPVEQLDKFGVDAVRYYTLQLPTFGNANWDEKSIVSQYNAHLVNDYGNLITRTLHLIDIGNVKITGPESEFKTKVDEILNYADNDIEDNLNISEYCGRLNELVKYGNQYINEKTPWKSDDSEITLNNIYYLLTQVTEYYSPIIPGKIDSIRQALKNLKKEILFEKLKTDE
jgi:methionyl-tRNA synthetase